MKRLLSILGSVGLVATASTAAVSCSTSKKTNQTIDPNAPTVAPQCIRASDTLIQMDGTNFSNIKNLSKNNFVIQQVVIQDNNIPNVSNIGIDRIGVSDNQVLIYLKTKMGVPSDKIPKLQIYVYYNFNGTPKPNDKGDSNTYVRPVVVEKGKK